MPDDTLRIMVVAGEASGDLHAAKLVRALEQAAHGKRFEFFGSAGPRMRKAGVEAIIKSDELSIVGLLEIGRALPMFIRSYRKLTRAARDRKPDVAVLVDFPDFNLRLAKSLKKLGIKVVYYISPQLWAWRSHRIRTIKNYVDLMITILPFEADWYRSRGVGHVEYVGSPLATEVHSDISREEFCRNYDLDPGRPIIALLPGSRGKEIMRILPIMLDAAALIKSKVPNIQFLIASGNQSSDRAIKPIAGDRWEVVTGATYAAVSAADAAAVASGTATLETAILGTPMAIVYATSSVNYKLLRPLISVEHFGLVNLIAGERLAKEMIQHEFTDEALAKELMRLLEPTVNAAMRGKLKETTDMLGHGGASKRAAEAVLRLIAS